MNRFIIIFILSILTTYGCSDVRFSSVPSEECANSLDCTEEDGLLSYEYKLILGRVDILFVNDNSGSMSTEQNLMASKFNDFIEKLDSKNISYRIAMITTDISSNLLNPEEDDRAANGYGKFQDGKLLEFTNGFKVLTEKTYKRSFHFEKTITRDETIYCESLEGNYEVENCPSGDERGIYALNMAIDRGNSDFFRKDTPLAVIILSDEDERSTGGSSSYPLESYDLPSTFVAKIKEQFDSRKLVSVHTMIIKPGDDNCKAKQDSQGNKWLDGAYGNQYAKLSNPDADLLSFGSITSGISGSICAEDYGSLLQEIGGSVSEESKKIQLPCNPVKHDVSSNSISDETIDYIIDDNNLLRFTSEIESGTEIYINIKCEK